MNELALARALQVLGVVGGVAMVTTVLLPAVQRYVNSGKQVRPSLSLVVRASRFETTADRLIIR
jgi:hypothetical protein